MVNKKRVSSGKERISNKKKNLLKILLPIIIILLILALIFSSNITGNAIVG